MQNPAYQQSSQQLWEIFETSREGLSSVEAQHRITEYWKNILSELHKTPQWVKFLQQFKDVLIILLIVSMFISIYLDDIRWATILGIIVLINAIIWYMQEAKAEKIMESLKKIMNPVAKVKRNGKLIEEKIENLVPWDCVYIEEWDNVPADLRIFETNNLQTNDFSLTWESSPVSKFTHLIPGNVSLGERNNCVFMWTSVATWYGRWIVVGTGMNTELWRIANLSQQQYSDSSPLQKEMQNIAKKLTIGTLILCGILVIVALFVHFTVHEAFIFAVGIAAAMVPQGLPAQVSIALSLAAWRLAKNKAVIKQLSSVETLGCVNIICTDKTGTLTKNEMTVKSIFLWNKVYSVSWTWYQNEWKIVWYTSQNEIEKRFFQSAFLASNAKINPPDSEHGNRYCIWDPTEWALICVAEKAGFNTEKLRNEIKQYHQYGFDSVRKMMSSVREIDGKTIAFVKWSPQSILDHCTQIYDGQQIRDITEDDKKIIWNHIENNAHLAMRDIGFAYKETNPYTEKTSMQETESDLIFMGICAIEDPAREEVPAAIKAAYDAKIKIIMITGDYGSTAEAIGHNIGLDQNGKLLVIPGEDLKKLDNIQLLKIIKKQNALIFSRAAPEDKLRIVSLIKEAGYVVAVTWDWINDAPALKGADIWVAMWKIGTDVAKEAAKIILLDDSFWTLVHAIKEGRIMYQNLRKTTISCITSNGGELFAILISLVVKSVRNIPIAITAVQILAIDLIWEMWPLTALTRDPAQRNIMRDKPRDTKEHIINAYTIIDLIRSGALMWWIWYMMYMIFFQIHHAIPNGLDTSSSLYASATSITYTTIMMCQYMNIISRRAGTTQHIFTPYLRANKKLLYAFAIGIWLISMLLYSSFWETYFGFGPLSLSERMLPISGWLIYLTIREIYKQIIKKYRRNII